MSETRSEDAVECDGCAGVGLERLDRATALSRLEIGDIICARSPKAPLIICLVTGITVESIVTRRITDGESYVFERGTGLEKTDTVTVEIVSVEPLPADIHDILLRIDRRNRLQADRTHFRLDEHEKRAFLMINEHYYGHQLDEIVGEPH